MMVIKIVVCLRMETYLPSYVCLWLSVFFAGGAVYDIMLTHGMGKSSVYKSVYGVVNAINADKSLAFNDNGDYYQ